MRVSLDIDELLRQERITPAEAERLRSLGAAEPPTRPTRGLQLIVVPALLGTIAGELIGAILLASNPGAWPTDRAIWVGALYGAAAGLLLGGGFGAVRWALFPYRSVSASEGGAVGSASAE
jgi:hypothetical protein